MEYDNICCSPGCQVEFQNWLEICLEFDRLDIHLCIKLQYFVLHLFPKENDKVLATEIHYTIADSKVTGTENKTYCYLYPKMNTGHDIRYMFA
jgi:hypothetical protein